MEGVLQQRDHAAVPGRTPRKACHAPSVFGPGQVQLLAGQPEQDLSGTAQLPELVENDPDHLLHAPVGVESGDAVRFPDVADWHLDPQLATLRLAPQSLRHAVSQDAQLELADGALHAKQQAVVGPARIIHLFAIDDPGTDQAAELEQVVPIPPVPRKPRSFRAEDGTDVSRAQHRHQPFEAGALGGPAGGTAEVVVDHIHSPEAAIPREIAEGILPPPALGVVLHLGHRGLADVDDGFAPQHRHREIRLPHRPPPLSREPPSGDVPTAPRSPSADSGPSLAGPRSTTGEPTAASPIRSSSRPLGTSFPDTVSGQADRRKPRDESKAAKS